MLEWILSAFAVAIIAILYITRENFSAPDVVRAVQVSRDRAEASALLGRPIREEPYNRLKYLADIGLLDSVRAQLILREI